MSDKLIPKSHAQVLTAKGFFQIWKLRRASGYTQEEAYHQTEALHRQVHMDGTNKYVEFCSFIRFARKQEAKLKQSLLQ